MFKLSIGLVIFGNVNKRGILLKKKADYLTSTNRTVKFSVFFKGI